jgi:ribosomal protein S18 acetylase RimI-like enzyme
MTEVAKPRLHIQIEPLDDSEIHEVADLAARTFVDAYGEYHDEDALAKTLDEDRSVSYFERTRPNSTVLVAKHAGKIVGYAQYGKVKLPGVTLQLNDMELSRLYVDTGLQNQGIGRQLIEAALSEPEMTFATNVYLRVWENNPDAISLYESLGFTQAGEIQFTIKDNQPTRDLIMVLHNPVSE